MAHQIQPHVSRVVQALLNSGAHTATKILAPWLVVRATRTLFRGRILSGRVSRVDIDLTIGRPNFRTRRFIKACQAAGEPFPIRKIWLRPVPVRRKAKRKVGRR